MGRPHNHGFGLRLKWWVALLVVLLVAKQSPFPEIAHQTTDVQNVLSMGHMAMNVNRQPPPKWLDTNPHVIDVHQRVPI